MRQESVRPYYDALYQKKGQLAAKRVFDFLLALILLIVLSPIMLILALAIKLDSKGTVMFRQVRVTQYGKEFRICLKIRNRFRKRLKQTQLLYWSRSAFLSSVR